MRCIFLAAFMSRCQIPQHLQVNTHATHIQHIIFHWSLFKVLLDKSRAHLESLKKIGQSEYVGSESVFSSYFDMLMFVYGSHN